MKTLLLIRHAKSSWKDETLPDRERPLNNRGKIDAPLMGKILFEKDIIPDLVLSSSAKRAKKTAQKIFFDIYGFRESQIHLTDDLYFTGVAFHMLIINTLLDKKNTVALVGHNPDFVDLIDFLTKETIEEMPTSGVYCLDFDVNSWKEVKENTGKVRFFEYPKKYKLS
jgi:phosphohistidine phosphatase